MIDRTKQHAIGWSPQAANQATMKKRNSTTIVGAHGNKKGRIAGTWRGSGEILATTA